MTDSIADMLTRIRNAYAVRKTEIILPMSKFKYSLARLLAGEGLVSRVEKISGGSSSKSGFDQIKIVLKYNKSGKPAISSLKKVSKPGKKVYCGHENLPTVLNNFGIAVVSTSRGLMTNKQARREKVGGEIICEIY